MLRNNNSVTDHSPIRIKKLIQLLGDPRLRHANQAEQSLILIGSDAVDALIEAASSKSILIRSRVAWILGCIGEHRAFETIMQLTRDTDTFTRYEAAWALGKLGDERAIEPLIGFLTTADDGGVQSSAYNGLCEMRDEYMQRFVDMANSADARIREIAADILSSNGEEVTATIAGMDSEREMPRSHKLRLIVGENIKETEEVARGMRRLCFRRKRRKRAAYPNKSVREVRGIFHNAASHRSADWETIRMETEKSVAEQVASEGVVEKT